MTALETLLGLPRRAKTPTPPLPVHLIGTSRTHLPGMFRDLGFRRGAEIGVWRGAYSATFCAANPKLRMLCVDPWLSYPAWRDTKNEMAPEKAEKFMAEAYHDAQAKLAPFPKATILRQFSTVAAETVADGSLDFVYIDGNHVYEAVTEDIVAWLPKVRSGGVIAGHDFRVFTNKPTIHVVAAVRDFTAAHGVDPWFITAADRTPSWLWVVP